MSWINNMLGNNNESTLNDKDYALELLASSKSDITLLSKCITESSNPELRKLFTNQLNSSINDYFKVSDLSKEKGYYNAFTAPSAQIKQEMQEAQALKQKEQQ